MTEQENLVYRFAEFELQPAERRLLHGKEPISLTPKVFEILRLLVGRAGHAVSKDEIMASIWPGRFVAESNLTKHIWTLRQALGESPEGGRFIRDGAQAGLSLCCSRHRHAASCGRAVHRRYPRCLGDRDANRAPARNGAAPGQRHFRRPGFCSCRLVRMVAVERSRARVSLVTSCTRHSGGGFRFRQPFA